MLDKYTNDISLLRTWYRRAKEVAIIAESMDTLNKAYIQPLHEFRYCLDHFMRSIDNEQEKKSEEIVKKSIVSAIGHLQRTYSDSVEWMLVNVKEEYINVLNQYTNEQIQAVFPEYYTIIRPELEEIGNIVDKYKNGKSVELATDIENGETELSDSELKMLKNITD